MTVKDAGDVIRLMVSTSPAEVSATLHRLREDERVGEVTVAGSRLLRGLFGGRATGGVDMAVEALRGDVPESRIRALAPAFLDAVGGLSPAG